MPADTVSPGREIRRRAHGHVDADLLELRFHVFGDGLLLLLWSGNEVDGQLHAVAEAGLVHQRLCLVQVHVEDRNAVVEEGRCFHDRPALGRGHTAVQGVGDELPINRVTDSLPHAHIAQLLRSGIEGQPVDRPDRGIPLVGDFQMVGVLQAPDFLAASHKGIHVRLAVLHGDQKGRGVLDDADDDLVQLGPPLEKEIRVLLEYDGLAGSKLLQHERTRTDGIRVGRVRFHVLSVSEYVLGQNRRQRRGQRQEKRRVRLIQLNDGGMRVGGFNALDRLEHRFERVVLLCRHQREGHILRGDRSPS